MLVLTQLSIGVLGASALLQFVLQDAAIRVLIPALSAQRSQPDLIDRRAKKLAKPFVTSAPWMLDYDKARAAAREEGKMLLTYFTRSYAP